MSPTEKQLVQFFSSRTPGSFCSSVEASERFGVTNDYITALCRRKKVKGVFVGRLWFVEMESLKVFLAQSRRDTEARHQKLAHTMRQEYERNQKTS